MFLPEEELFKLKFKKVGKNVKISDKASIYSPHLIEIGDNVRIDDYTILSPGSLLQIGSNVHIACFCSLIGKGEITLQDFSGLSSRVSIYSSSDDYSGAYLTNPTIPDTFKMIHSGPVTLGKHSIVGSGTVIFPDTTLEEGVAVGALSLIKGLYSEWGIFAGIPARLIKKRKRELLQLEKEYMLTVF